MRKMLFIFNPRSGKAQIRNRLMDILDIFTKAGYEVSVHVTQRPKDAMEVAAARGNDADLIVRIWDIFPPVPPTILPPA